MTGLFRPVFEGEKRNSYGGSTGKCISLGTCAKGLNMLGICEPRQYSLKNNISLDEHILSNTDSASTLYLCCADLIIKTRLLSQPTLQN